MTAAEEKAQELTADSLQRLHALHNLAGLLAEGVKGVAPTLRDSELRRQEDAIRNKYLSHVRGLQGGKGFARKGHVGQRRGPQESRWGTRRVGWGYQKRGEENGAGQVGEGFEGPFPCSGQQSSRAQTSITGRRRLPTPSGERTGGRGKGGGCQRLTCCPPRGGMTLEEGSALLQPSATTCLRPLGRPTS